MASFKDIYEQDKTKKKEPALKPEDIKVEEVEVAPIQVGEGLKADDVPVEVKREMTVLEEQFVRVDITESIKDVLTEQREETAKVLESVMKSNTKIANNVAKHVKQSSDVNQQLVEAIISLSEKIEMLETKLEAIENLEIPTPIVQLQAPRIKKQVHRDKKGMVTHVTEEIVADDDDVEE